MMSRTTRLTAWPTPVAARRSPRPAAWLLIVAALAAGCTKVPLFAPTGSSITLSASRTTAPLNTPITITAVVQESGGTPAQNGTLVTFSSNLGTFDPVEARTNSGRVAVTYNTGTLSGTATIVATSGSSKLTNTSGSGTTGSSGLQILIGSAAAASVVVSADPSSVASSGGTVTISASAFDEFGNVLPGISISFSTDVGTLSASSAIADGSGVAKVQLTTTKAATVTATAGARTVNATVKVTVNAAPVVTLGSPTGSLTVGSPISFTVTPTSGSTPNVTVDFGDNTSQDLGSVTAARTVTHTYTTQGSYTITARSTDPTTNETASTTLGVTIGARPVATVTLEFTPASPTAGVAVLFTVTPVPGTGGALPVSSIKVAFGDGSESSVGAVTGAATVAHTYTSAGTYAVTATLTDTGGFTSTATKTVTVAPRLVNTITIGAPSSVTVNVPASFTFTPGSSGSSPTTNVRVDFGDGSSAVDLGAITSQTTVLHKYTASGTYQVKATLTDASSSTSTASVFVSVGNPAPLTVTLTAAPSSPKVGISVVFTAVATLPTGSTATITEYAWNFGDGDTENTTTNTTRHAYSNPGTYAPSVTVTSSDSNTGTGTASVAVTP